MTRCGDEAAIKCRIGSGLRFCVLITRLWILTLDLPHELSPVVESRFWFHHHRRRLSPPSFEHKTVDWSTDSRASLHLAKRFGQNVGLCSISNRDCRDGLEAFRHTINLAHLFRRKPG